MIDFGDGVSLEPLTKPPIEWRNSPLIWRWTRQNDLLNHATHAAWFEAQAKDPSIKMYMIMADAKAVGVCGLTSINMQNRNAEFSLYIHPDFHGRRLGKCALITLFRHGFRNLGLVSIWGETFEDNPAQRTFKEIGMREDGRRRCFYWKDGKFCDAILFSILCGEFTERHGDVSCF